MDTGPPQNRRTGSTQHICLTCRSVALTFDRKISLRAVDTHSLTNSNTSFTFYILMSEPQVKPSPTRRIRNSLGLERNIVVMSAAVFLIGAGEELWKSFLPKYLEALGASAAII